MSKINFDELNDKGITLLKNQLSTEWIENLKLAVDGSFDAHRAIQLKNNVEIKTNGVALHVVLNDGIFIKFLEHLSELGLMDEIKENYFKSNFILNSFGALNSIPNSPSFAAVVHRDIRFFSGSLNVMLNILVMLDDFTEENGATLLLPESHKKEEKPSDEEFHQQAIQMTGKKGDILLFNSNVWHAAAINKTPNSRRALTLTFSKSFVKQQLDYPRAMGYENLESYPENIQQILGCFSRVPASLDEWYQPLEKRFYKKNQD